MKQPVTIFGVDYGKEDMTVISVIDKGKYIHSYKTIDDWFRFNGERHLERAIAYASAGYPDKFYEGSMRKAIRNLNKAEELKLDPLTESILKPIMDAISKRIYDSIMYGTQFTKTDENGNVTFVSLQDIYKV